jgi:hypothetical protein
MLIRYDALREALKMEGLVERESFTFYYSPDSDEFVFTPEPDPDGMIELAFALPDIARWDDKLADRVKRRLAAMLRSANPRN